MLVVVLQPSRGRGCDKLLIINTYILDRPRSMLPGRRTERLVHKLYAENQVFTRRAAARWLQNKGKRNGYTNKGHLRLRLELRGTVRKQHPANRFPLTRSSSSICRSITSREKPLSVERCLRYGMLIHTKRRLAAYNKGSCGG